MKDDSRGELTAKLWVFLLKTGGRWLSADLAAKVREDPTQVCCLLAAMAQTGSVAQFPVPGMARRFTYGVTGACRIPAWSPSAKWRTASARWSLKTSRLPPERNDNERSRKQCSKPTRTAPAWKSNTSWQRTPRT